MDRISKEQRSKNMQAIRSSGSEIEVALAKALFAIGLRYRKNVKSVFGKPDLIFRKDKIAIFIDSEFWHGKDWDIRKHDLKSNKDFWHKKIERNIQRDIEVNNHLLEDGWKVLRFWGNDIRKNLRNCVNIILDAKNERKNQHSRI